MTMPEGWGAHRPPPAAPWTDISIYELHIRDFRYRPTVLLTLASLRYVIPHACLLTCLLAYLSASVCIPVKILSLLTCTPALLHAARAHAAGLHHMSRVLHVTCSFVMCLISHHTSGYPP